MMDLARVFGERLLNGERLWLFLDYDGTLAEFAPTPDTILPDPDLIDLLSRLAKYPHVLRVTVLSGREFRAIHALLPVRGIMIAGTYGIEFMTWQGEKVRLLDVNLARPFLNKVKKAWATILDGQQGFYLEDKGYSLAIHARFAAPAAAEAVLSEAVTSARAAARSSAAVKVSLAARTVEAGRTVVHTDNVSHPEELNGAEVFRILGDDRFLEVAPAIANKGQSVNNLLKRFPWPGADILYLGDDDKDEEAFRVVVQHQGTGILVAEEPRPTAAQYRLNTPLEARGFLRALLTFLEPA